MNPVQARGTTRTRGSRGTPAPTQLTADVLTPSGDHSGTTLVFDLRSAPEITTGNRFVMTLSTETAGYDGRTVICTVALPNVSPVSFEAPITPTGAGEERVVTFEDDRLPIADCQIPST